MAAQVFLVIVWVFSGVCLRAEAAVGTPSRQCSQLFLCRDPGLATGFPKVGYKVCWRDTNNSVTWPALKSF